MVVVDARGDLTSGVFGEMMLTFFKGRGGAGVVIDGCIRDYTHVQHLNLPLWLCGVTPTSIPKRTLSRLQSMYPLLVAAYW